MQTIKELLAVADNALYKYVYYRRLEILSQGKGHIKFRLYISKNLFIQINRNEIVNLTNMVLLHDFKRIFARFSFNTLFS